MAFLLDWHNRLWILWETMALHLQEDQVNVLGAQEYWRFILKLMCDEENNGTADRRGQALLPEHEEVRTV